MSERLVSGRSRHSGNGKCETPQQCMRHQTDWQTEAGEPRQRLRGSKAEFFFAVIVMDLFWGMNVDLTGCPPTPASALCIVPFFPITPSVA